MEKEGCSFEQAEEIAIDRMGSAEEIAQSINAVNRLSWHNVLKYIMLAASAILGIMTVQSAFYPSTSEIVSESVVDGVYYMEAIGKGGVHGPEFIPLLFTTIMIMATIVIFRYSSIKTRMIYIG